MSTRKPDEEIMNNFPSTSTVARRAECDAFVPGDEFWELSIIRVKVAVVIIPPDSWREHSRTELNQRLLKDMLE